MSFDTAVETRTCDDGVRVVRRPGGTPGVAAIVARLEVGSGDDPPGRDGLAHLVEHLAFGRLSSGRGYDATLFPSGAHTNGWTTADTTTFATVVDADEVAAAVVLEAERLHGPAPTADDVARELRVLAAEARDYADPARDALRALAFGSVPAWRRPTQGRQLDGVTVDEVTTWTTTAWRAPLVVAIVGGPTDLDVSAFCTLPAREAATPAPAPAPAAAVHDGTRALWPTVPQAHPDRPALDLVARLVGGETQNGRRAGYFTAEDATDALKTLRVDGPDEGDLARVKAEVDLDLVTRLADPQGLALGLAGCVATVGRPCLDGERAAYADVGISELRRVVATWLSR